MANLKLLPFRKGLFVREFYKTHRAPLTSVWKNKCSREGSAQHFDQYPTVLVESVKWSSAGNLAISVSTIASPVLQEQGDKACFLIPAFPCGSKTFFFHFLLFSL